MCNGDLGMYRVMPWAYPTIPGQSSGGTSVDPTPEPEPVIPYDFTGMSASWVSKTVKTYGSSSAYADFGVKVSGITVIDSSNVSSLKLIVTPNGTVSVSPSSIGGKTVSLSYKNGTYSKSNPNGSPVCVTAEWTGATGQSGKNVTISGSVKLTYQAYDANGNLLQEFSKVVS